MNCPGPFMSIGRGGITMVSPGGRGRGSQIMTIGGNGFINPPGSSIMQIGSPGRGGITIVSNGGRGRGNYSVFPGGSSVNFGQIQQIAMPNPITGAGGGMFMSMPGMTMSIPFQGGRGAGLGMGSGLSGSTSAGSTTSGSRTSGSRRSASSRAPSSAGARSVYEGSQGPFRGGGGGTAAP
ncbi:hypothetical protein CKM354_001057800 [Cercospora kikuchii]|uniref:Uncharacterized protein n=1 Tax=Cercospora kikuchii TaxID=84275 RepID=A0A9P3CZ93_9PEZI|nr:uncharacterized protein CKM354_001057800 [Cercospora kikuchii]GIZ47488.1 hypothetical protein CKM354_001057800 [Cercospora kikuchii]